MGIMTKMRDRMKIILGILILAFLATIIFSWGMGYSGNSNANNIIGSVNGKDITLDQFYQRYNNEISRYREQSGQEVTEPMRVRIRNQVWDELINEMLVQSEIEKYGLKATDEEIYFELENNPPEVLKTQEAFLTDGKFDMNKYLNILHNPQGNEWLQIENYFRSTIPSQKLQNLITATVMVGDKEIRDAYIDENVNFQADYLSVPFTMTSDNAVTVSDDEVEAYYDENKENDYATPEKRVVQYVFWKKTPGKEDTTLVLQDMDEVRARMEDGETFQDLAKLYSQDGSAERGGDLGWVTPGQMVPAFEKAVYSAPLNKVVGPVLTQFGYHLILVTERKTEDGVKKAHAYHILIKIETGPNTVDALSGDARLFSYDAEDLGFSRALETYKLKADTSKNGIAREEYYFPGVGYTPELTKYAFSAKVGQVSEVLETDQNFVIAQLLEIREPGFQNLDVVKPAIVRELKREKKEKIAKAYADSLYTLAQGGASLEALASAKAALAFKGGESFLLKSLPAALKGNDEIKEVLKDLSPNEISSPVKSGRAYVIMQLRNKGKVDDNQYAMKKMALHDQLLTQKKNEVITRYMNDLKDNAKIKDFRTNFF